MLFNLNFKVGFINALIVNEAHTKVCGQSILKHSTFYYRLLFTLLLS